MNSTVKIISAINELNAIVNGAPTLQFWLGNTQVSRKAPSFKQAAS